MTEQGERARRREQKLRPDIAAALAIAREFARAHGLDARYNLRWEENIDISWQTDGIRKMILISVYGFRIEGSAAVGIAEPTRKVDVRRGFGGADPAESGWEGVLGYHLAQALDWLQGMDLASVLELDAADSEHALSRIAPIVQEFASRAGLQVSRVERDRCVLEWPSPRPRFQLGVLYRPQWGILFRGLQFVRRGLLIRRRITVDCVGLEGLDIADWTELNDLANRLAEARARLEACTPGKDAVETYI